MGHPSGIPAGGTTTRSGFPGQLTRYQSCSNVHFVFIGSSVCQYTSAFQGMAMPDWLVVTSVGTTDQRGSIAYLGPNEAKRHPFEFTVGAPAAVVNGSSFSKRSARSRRISLTVSIGSARIPPLTGSMTTTGFPCALQISRFFFELTPGFSQSA